MLLVSLSSNHSLRCRLSVPNFMCKSLSSSLIQSSVVSLPSNFLGKSLSIRSGALCEFRTSFASHRGLRRIAHALFVWSELLRRFAQALSVRPEVRRDLRCGFAKQQFVKCVVEFVERFIVDRFPDRFIECFVDSPMSRLLNPSI
jgi:hypothetical protein